MFSGLPYLLDFFCSKTMAFVVSVQFMVQQIINSISGMTIENGKGNKEIMKKFSKEIDSVRFENAAPKNDSPFSCPAPSDSISAKPGASGNDCALSW